MAVVQNPFLSVKARGSVGGLTATLSGVGAVMKAKARPPKRTRYNQDRVRSVLGWVARYYGNLSAAQRDQWEAYATNHPQPDGFGGTFILTAEQAFIKLNVVAVHQHNASRMQVSPPTDPPGASIPDMGAVDGGSTGEVNLSWGVYGTPSADDYTQIQRAGPFQSPGRVEIHNRYRDTKLVTGMTYEYTYVGLLAEMWYWFRVRYVDQYGQVTSWVICQHKAPTV